MNGEPTTQEKAERLLQYLANALRKQGMGAGLKFGEEWFTFYATDVEAVLAALKADNEKLQFDYLDAIGKVPTGQPGIGHGLQLNNYGRRCYEAGVVDSRERFFPCREGRPHYCPNCDNSFQVGSQP